MTESSSSSSISEITETAVADVDRYLAKRLAQVELPENLLEAVRYALLGGGKRLRPVLTLFSCDAVGGRREAAMAPAAALELIHAFSLVHDDLPAMDDDDLRRGRPTLHVHAGEAMAILAGDAMMSLAFEFVAGAELGERKTAAITAELARGTTAMIAGQVYDTLGGFPDRLPPHERLHLTHRNKTGALILAACRIGAICGGANTPQLRALSAYGEAVGLMFQVVDDLLDVTQSAEHIGKATGKDLPAGKLTYPGLMGVEGSRAEIVRLERAAMDSLSDLGPAADSLRDLCRYMAIRTR